MEQPKITIEYAKEMYNSGSSKLQNWALENYSKEELEQQKQLTVDNLYGKFIETGNEYMNMTVQQKLFDLGFIWYNESKDYNLFAKCIVVDDVGKTFKHGEREYLEKRGHKEIRLNQLLNISKESIFKVGNWITSFDCEGEPITTKTNIVI